VEGNLSEASSVCKLLARKAAEYLAKITRYNKRSITECGQAPTVRVAKTSVCCNEDKMITGKDITDASWK